MHDRIKEAEAIVKEFGKLTVRAETNGTPIRYNLEHKKDLILYFNEDYNTIFVDKSEVMTRRK